MTDADSQPPLRYFNPAAITFDADVAIAMMADRAVRAAIERGEFEDLPGRGQPLDLPDHYDPDWWAKSLLRRAGCVMIPPSVQMRKEDAALDAKLDELSSAAAVRREVIDFNERVIRARYQPPAGPPMLTLPRDVEATVAAWAERRRARAAEARREAAEAERRSAAERRAAARDRWRIFGRRKRQRAGKEAAE